ncbi:hypothetical protein Tco_0366468 [Tanacetum coccineum]
MSKMNDFPDDDSFTNINLNDFEDKEEAAYSEAVMEIFKKNIERIFVIQNKPFSLTLEEFSQVLKIPFKGQASTTEMWSLDHLSVSVPSKAKIRADRGKKQPHETNASSSSTTHNPPSSSLQIDVIVDDNDDESSQSNSSSPTQHISSSSNVVSGVHQNPPHENHDLNTLLSETISFQIQQRDEHRDGLRSIGQTLKNMMGGKRK